MPLWRRALYRVVVGAWFNRLIFAAIMVNTLVLAMDHHPIDKTFDMSLNIVNLTLTVVFFLEMVIKILALGAREYVKDSYNNFDALVVFMSLIEVLFEYVFQIEQGGGFSALRAFRIF